MIRIYHSYPKAKSTISVRAPVTAQNVQLVVCIDSITMAFISPRGSGSCIKCSRGSSCSSARGCANGFAIVVIRSILQPDRLCVATFQVHRANENHEFPGQPG